MRRKGISANDIVILSRGKIYDVYVKGRFYNFFETFGEAIMEIERLRGG